MGEVKTWAGLARAPFLVLTPVCVLVGIGAASRSGESLDWLSVVLALIGAAAAHISVNALNEFSDFKSGLDLRTVKTPFSGGSGTLPDHPGRTRTALALGWIAAAVTVAVGGYFFRVRGWGILPLGILGLALVFTYTRWITRSPVGCLLAPGLGFGPLMVMGTDFVLSGHYSWTAGVASLVPLFLVSDLLLLNQFPDVEADRAAGRRHLPIVIGREKSVVVYGAFLGGAYFSILAGVALNALPAACLVGLVTLVIAFPTLKGVRRHAGDIPRLVPWMGMNVVLILTTPLGVAVGLLVG